MKRTKWFTAAFFAIALLAGGAGPEGAYQVKTVWHLGGDGRWDYCLVDSAAKVLYVTRQTHVQVIGLADGKLAADLPDTAGAHGIALVPDLNRGFVSDGKAGAVTVFDMKTWKELGTIPAGKNPDAIIYDPASKRVLAFNGRSSSSTVIDPAAEPGAAAVVATIPLEGKPEFAAADGQGHVFVNLENKNSIAEIDSQAMKVTAVWPIEGGEEPSGLAIDPAHHHLFAGCDNEVMAILDTQTGKTLGTAPIGKGVDACGFNPDTGEAFASCGDGTLTVVKETSPGTFAVSQTVQTRKGARTMALDRSTQTIYLPTAELAPGSENSERPTPVAGTFMIVVVGRD